jgi:hypothetical protein
VTSRPLRGAATRGVAGASDGNRQIKSTQCVRRSGTAATGRVECGGKLAMSGGDARAAGSSQFGASASGGRWLVSFAVTKPPFSGLSVAAQAPRPTFVAPATGQCGQARGSGAGDCGSWLAAWPWSPCSAAGACAACDDVAAVFATSSPRCMAHTGPATADITKIGSHAQRTLRRRARSVVSQRRGSHTMESVYSSSRVQRCWRFIGMRQASTHLPSRNVSVTTS